MNLGEFASGFLTILLWICAALWAAERQGVSRQFFRDKSLDIVIQFRVSKVSGVGLLSVIMLNRCSDREVHKRPHKFFTLRLSLVNSLGAIIHSLREMWACGFGFFPAVFRAMAWVGGFALESIYLGLNDSL